MRNKLGQFVYGTKNESLDIKIKRLESLKRAWKGNPTYLGELKLSPLYNVWRSFRFTKKGQKIGSSYEWHSFKKFFEDMKPTYQDKYRLCRINKSKPFSKENCMWTKNEYLSLSKENLNTLTYKGQTLTLKEWAINFNIPLNALRQRFYKGKRYTTEEILFGRRFSPKKLIKDKSELSAQKIRTKVSKMISAHRCRDIKHGFTCDLTIDWFIENIICKECSYCFTDKNIGCDRLDNKKGHLMDNVVPCCYTCNTVKSDIFSFDEMRILGKTIKNIIENRATLQIL